MTSIHGQLDPVPQTNKQNALFFQISLFWPIFWPHSSVASIVFEVKILSTYMEAKITKENPRHTEKYKKEYLRKEKSLFFPIRGCYVGEAEIRGWAMAK